MGKIKEVYVCVECQATFSKWLGRCTECNNWNSIVLARSFGKERSSSDNKMNIMLDKVDAGNVERMKTGISEFDIVCGGGMIPGSVILIGGEPGIGKSTLALQIASCYNTLYISGEESLIQLKRRADRLGLSTGTIQASQETDVETIAHTIEIENPQCVIIDSIQTMYSNEIGGSRGSVAQVRECTGRIFDAAKKSDAVVLLIGHITKDGNIAGPKILEHLVDTVLYFEGNLKRDLRMLRAFKNRFGSINEIGLFAMSESGLKEVKDKNRVFFNPFISSKPGNAVSAALEGSRILLFEVQSLVLKNDSGNPRKMSDGFDINRLIILCAVIEKHTGMALSHNDVFINVSGGFQINETTADLAVAVSILSSLKNISIAENTAFIGEISLSGEVRPVAHFKRRIQELIYGGFTKVIVPQSQVEEFRVDKTGCELMGVGSIKDLLAIMFD